MQARQILTAIVILGTLWQTAAAQPRKKIEVGAPPLEHILVPTSMQFNPVLSDLSAVKLELPLGPQDVLKSYEIAMGLVAERTSTDFAVIVRAQQANQITREQAEYLLQQRYQIAMMQYEVLSALHDVLNHDIDEVTLQSKRTLKAASSDEVLVVVPPVSPSGSE